MDSDTNFNTPSEKNDRSIENVLNGSLNYSSSPATLKHVCGPKKIVVMRHGERVDDLFPSWIERAEAKGCYDPFDNNMPSTLEPLKRPVREYDNDTPLTQMGNVMAQMVGRGLLVNDLAPDVIYASPAFRCIQTAATVAGMSGGRNCVIRIEPGLFENNDLYPNGAPSWLDVEDLCAAGFNIDHKYQPFFTRDDVWFHTETASSYNRRINATFDEIFSKESTSNANGCVLISAHASTLDLSVGYFAMPRRFVKTRDLVNIGDRIPYCCTAIFHRQNAAENAPFGVWRYYGETALPPITYRGFTSRPDYKFLTRKSSSQKHLQ